MKRHATGLTPFLTAALFMTAVAVLQFPVQTSAVTAQSLPSDTTGMKDGATSLPDTIQKVPRENASVPKLSEGIIPPSPQAASLARYTEKVLEYSLNGMMKRFQRHGLKANHVHGKVDNLYIRFDGNRVQSVAYYPFGGVIADLGFGHGEQQYKFGGKELDMSNGLNEYDFGARRYYQGVSMFTQPDPMAENFLWHSPYVYCGNNPVNVVDPSGKKEYGIDSNGYIRKMGDYEMADIVYIVDNLGLPTGSVRFLEANSIDVKIGNTALNNEIYDRYTISGYSNAKELFEFLSKETSVEWSQISISDDERNFISTSHRTNSESGVSDIIYINKDNFKFKNIIHSHPGGNELPSYSFDTQNGDIFQARYIVDITGQNPTFKIYIPKLDRYVTYTPYENEYELDELVVNGNK